MIKKLKFVTLFVGGIAFLSACSDDAFNEIESSLPKDPNYNTDVYTATVSVSNIKEKAIQTNGLSGYLLGKYTQAPFGTKNATIASQVILPSENPRFGALTQADETAKNTPENEKVTEAYLYIPFFNINSSNSRATYNKDTEYQLDSIYGNKDASFAINVSELNYYLSNIGTDYQPKTYYSNDTDIPTHIGTSVASVTSYTISNKSITRYQFDDPKTQDDESKKEADVLAPGIRIPLSTSFFQTKIIDKEGSDELSNAEKFSKYFKGLVISTSNFSKDLMMLLNMAGAKIEIVYSYDTTNNGTKSTLKSRYELNLGGGITVNLLSNSDENLSDSAKTYLSGALGQTASITIADTDITKFKEGNWLITDASLYLYVDNSVTYAKEPDRLFVYNAETGNVLVDYQYDPTSAAETAASSYLIHLGKLQKQNGKGAYYQLRITNHLVDLIKNSTNKNIPLGITVASSVKVTTSGVYLDTSGANHKIALTTLATPLSTVIKDVQLIIHYTKAK